MGAGRQWGAAAIELLVTDVYAAARGQELPDLPSTPSPPKPTKLTKPTPAPPTSKKRWGPPLGKK